MFHENIDRIQTRQKPHIHDHTTHNTHSDAEMVGVRNRFLEKSIIHLIIDGSQG